MVLTLSWVVSWVYWGINKECDIVQNWDEKYKNEHESVRVCEQIREMCSWGGGGGVCGNCFCLIRKNVAQLFNLYVQDKSFKKCYVLNVHVYFE